MLKKILFKLFDILPFYSFFLLAFIPIYPKFPLFELIEGYIVRARLEDVLILLANFILILAVLFGKYSIKTPITKFVFAYAVFGFLSVVSAIFLTQTVPLDFIHIAKTTLHYLRYLEYFSLFFITYVGVKTTSDLDKIGKILSLVVILVSLYGLGQKYLYFPVYSTMNREFSKGVTLYLTEHARVQSTFGGHYDMAAYLVLVIPFLYVFMKIKDDKITQSIYLLAFILGTLMMVMSASRTSFAGFLIGLYSTVLLLSLQKQDYLQKFKTFIRESILVTVIVGILFVSFGDSISERISQTLRAYKPISDGLDMIVETKRQIIIAFEKRFQFNEIVHIDKPINGISTDQAAVLVSSDTRPTPIRPSDVFTEVPDKITIATVSATGEKTTVTLEVPRNYSDNALKYGLSLAIRLDTLWPQALNGFYKNPLLGSGYATLTKSSVEQFTEAESTDNNFLRTLGETGGLGFVSFYGAIIYIFYYAHKHREKLYKNPTSLFILVAMFGGTVGLLLNAVFIDVFAASKVALTFWSLCGVSLKAVELNLKK